MIGTGWMLGIPVPVWIAGIVVLLAIFVTRQTRLGRYIYAIGGNENAAILSGISINKVKLIVYGIAGALAAVGGIMVTSRLDSAQPNAGTGYELDAIAAVVIGGTSLSGGKGSIGGTVMGAVIIGVQWVFYLFFFALYLVSSKTAHRVVGYFEEEAVISYTHYLAEIDEGRSANVPAPEIAKRYWSLPDHATLRDVVLVVRADEAHHRDVNHGFANELAGLPTGAVADCPPHVALEPIWKKAA